MQAIQHSTIEIDSSNDDAIDAGDEIAAAISMLTQLIMDAVRGQIENEIEWDHDEAEEEDEEAAHERIAN